MSNILVDTSVWIEGFRHAESEAQRTLTYLLQEERIVTAGVVIAELLQGEKSERRAVEIESLMLSLPVLPDEENTWTSAARISRSLRRSGIVVPLTDLLIAQLAIENDCLIYTLDSHFDRIPDLPRFTPTSR
ncbi:MAG: PIN domain-containing protein [Armatimonadetes bacterium]|nr:PIN domain-containing protein [Armatimonadota bacterium]